MKCCKINRVFTPDGVHVMTQITLLEVFGYAIRLHLFYATDNEGFHSHPRSFVSLCVWGLYTEYLAGKSVPRIVTAGTITRRKATDIHRVSVTLPQKWLPAAVTLAIAGPVERNWTREFNRLKIVLLGKPGVGKGTQGKKISERYGIPHISIGDECRRIMGDYNHPLYADLHHHLWSCVGNWQPLPTNLAVQVMQDAVKGLSSWVMDGFPRNVEQAELSSIKSLATHFVYYDLDDETCMQRVIGRNRSDDAIASCIERLRVEQIRLPLLMEYLSACSLIVVSALETPDTVFSNTINKIELCNSNKETPPVRSHVNTVSSRSMRLEGRYGIRTRLPE